MSPASCRGRPSTVSFDHTEMRQPQHWNIDLLLCQWDYFRLVKEIWRRINFLLKVENTLCVCLCVCEQGQQSVVLYVLRIPIQWTLFWFGGAGKRSVVQNIPTHVGEWTVRLCLYGMMKRSFIHVHVHTKVRFCACVNTDCLWSWAPFLTSTAVSVSPSVSVESWWGTNICCKPMPLCKSPSLH